jgi:tetratricopeptide (TPR) repeat protein
MDWYEGETLKQKITSGLLKIDEAIEILIQVSQGLSAAHEKGIIHRDIKPANIFITDRNEVKILDFGLATSNAYTKITRLESTKGTIAYISPEQAQGKEATHQSDIWSLGVVMFQMLTGQLPFKGDVDQVIIYSILDKEPEKITSINPEIPLELENIVLKALEKNRELRYQNIEEMLDDLISFKNKLSGSNGSQFISPPKRKNNRFKTVIISTLMVMAAAIAFYFVNPNFFSGLQNDIPISLAVISFENQTGDSSYNYLQKAIPNLLITNLEQAEYLHLITWERMHDLLKQIGKEEVELIDKDLAFKLCRMDGIDAIVLGSFVKAGDVFVTDVKVLDASNKKLLKSANIKSEGVQSILENQIDYLSKEIAEGIGISAREIESVQLRIADVSTNSMEAYNYFLQGREEFEKRYYDDSRKFLEKAIELDSTYAAAYLYLAWVYDNLKYIEKELNAYEKAKIFSKKATEKERLYIEASYAERIEKLPDKRFSILNQMVKKFPREKRIYISLGSYYRHKLMYKEAVLNLNKALELDPEFGQAINLLATTYSDMKNYDKAIEYYNRYASVFPGDADPFESIGDLYFNLGELNKALESFKKALEIKPDFGSGLRIAYIYVLKENYTEAIKWLDHYISTIPSPIQAYGYIWKGIYHSFLGQYKQSLNDISMMQGIMKSVGNEEKIATGSMFKGMIYLDMGDYEKSRICIEVFFNVAKKNQNLINYIGGIQFLAGFDLMEGKIDSANLKIADCEALLVKLSEENPYKANALKTALKFVYMELLMAEGSFEEAISIGENLDTTLSANFEIEGLIMYNYPFLRDALARAYYLNDERDKAIAEYERLITFNPASNNRRLIHPKYHYRLAKLYEEKGFKKKAIREFEKFLELWKDADKGIPQFVDVERRLAKLIAK